MMPKRSKRPYVYISYARSDKYFVEHLVAAFHDQNVVIWWRSDDYYAAMSWPEKIRETINRTDTFIFVISQYSLRSRDWQLELDYAIQVQKRIIPIIIDKTVIGLGQTHDWFIDSDFLELQKRNWDFLQSLQWIFFDDKKNFEDNFRLLLSALFSRDDVFIKQHSLWLMRANEWNDAGNRQEYLLTGEALQAAKAWLNEAERKDLASTNNVRAYIAASEQAEEDRSMLVIEHRHIPAGPSTVYFSTYFPEIVEFDRQYGLYVYAHLDDNQQEIVDHVQLFRNKLGGTIKAPKRAKQSARLRHGTPVTVVPESGSIEFSLPAITLKWNSKWIHFGFNFKLSRNNDKHPPVIRVSIRVGGVEIAHINCILELSVQTTDIHDLSQTAQNPLALAKLKNQKVQMYKKIFVSYSRKDKNVIEAYRFAQLAIGNDVFVDTYSIRSGADWKVALAEAIDKADIFQLFWSIDSAHSPNVRDEWTYALTNRCSSDKCVDFICPVFWVDPIPVPPPEELSHLNFKYVPFNVPKGVRTKVSLMIFRIKSALFST